jgi:hypothetical protein
LRLIKSFINFASSNESADPAIVARENVEEDLKHQNQRILNVEEPQVRFFQELKNKRKKDMLVF